MNPAINTGAPAGPAAVCTPARPCPEASLFLWIGRGLAVVVTLFSGAFLLSHLTGWGLSLRSDDPPTWVSIGVLLHAVTIFGLLLSLRWTVVGSIVALLATAAFIVQTGVNTGAYPLVMVFTLAPLPAYAMWWRLRRGSCASASADAPVTP